MKTENSELWLLPNLHELRTECQAGTLNVITKCSAKQFSSCKRIGVFVVIKFSDKQPELSEVVKEVARHYQEQEIVTGKNLKLLKQLELQVSELEKEKQSLLLECQATEKQICTVENDILQTQKFLRSLEKETHAIFMENVKCQLTIEQEEEKFQILLEEFNTYRNKMESYKEDISKEEGSFSTRKELMEKKEMVKNLKAKKEALRIDLQNPDGSLVRSLQEELFNLKTKIDDANGAISDLNSQLIKEEEIQLQLKKEIEMLNRRSEAIIRRLHCQLNKAQANKRLQRWNIEQLQKKLVYLRKCLGSTK
ncbi:coiled-coil domain-containing protein 122-like [Erpetoichthys calabaricus]|uniref:coiled-coil domain-containing protein 122-like n=1 Tax=Erpetoichthys calabaricus TaxID=27687 RepID=UPI00223419C7|nr:coiled-coil domain-containing protein 122-like [Erpetoichthys calabaricus]